MRQLDREKIFVEAAEVSLYPENPAAGRSTGHPLLGTDIVRTVRVEVCHHPGRGLAHRDLHAVVPNLPTSAIYSLCSQRRRAERARRTYPCHFVTERSEIHYADP